MKYFINSNRYKNNEHVFIVKYTKYTKGKKKSGRLNVPNNKQMFEFQI